MKDYCNISKIHEGRSLISSSDAYSDNTIYSREEKRSYDTVEIKRENDQITEEIFSYKIITANKCSKTVQNQIKKTEFGMGLKNLDKLSQKNQILIKKTAVNQIFQVNKERFNCTSCKKLFSSKRLLDKHLRNCKLNSSELFTCNYKECSKLFKNSWHLKKHLLVHQFTFVCDECCEMFKIKSDLEQHIHQNHCGVLNIFTCDICQQTFTEKNSLKEHIKNHVNTLSHIFVNHKENFSDNTLVGHFVERISYQCIDCNKLFVSQQSLDRHSQECCLGQKCPQCCRVFKNIYFKKHLKSHLNFFKKCQNCCQVFFEISRYSEHLKSLCLSQAKLGLLVCCECNKTYKNSMRLKLHILKFHKCEKFVSQGANVINSKNCELPEKYSCEICGETFLQINQFKLHLSKHDDSLTCQYCHFVFLNKDILAKHLEKLNCCKKARTTQKAQLCKKCQICQAHCETDEELIKHYETTHPDKKKQDSLYCSESFPCSEKLQTHINSLEVEKLKCDFCEKKFRRQYSLRKHKIKHTGNITPKKFKCKYCNCDKFSSESKFLVHEKKCKKNLENRHVQPSEKSENQDRRLKPRRQLNWKSKIIMTHFREGPQVAKQTESGNKNENSLANFFENSDSEVESASGGWFDKYYKIEEDDLAFGIKSEDKAVQGSDCAFDNNESLPSKRKKSLPPNGSIHYSLSSSTDSSSESIDEDIKEELPIDYNPKKCRLCILTFTQEYELLHHFIKNHPWKNAHKCPKCEVECPLFAQLKEHLKTHGIGMGVFNCDNCSKKFRSEKKMKSHNIRCKGMNEFERGIIHPPEEQCRKCGKKFHTKFGYRRHKQLCKSKKIKKKFESKENSEADIFVDCNDILQPETEVEHYNAEEGVKNCQILGNNKIEPESNKIEEKKKKKSESVGVTPPVPPPLDSFPCRLCDKKFQYEKGLVTHFKTVHPGEKPLICHICNVHLAEKLKEHLKTHGIGEEFICELCGKRFNQKFQSKIHDLWHQGVEYKCNNCKQKFLSKEKMEMHINENRCGNRECLKFLPCEICGKSFKSKFNLGKHSATHLPKELRPKRFSCEYCGKWFESKMGVVIHRRIHTGEAPYCCRYCPKTFRNGGNLQLHEKIHTGESKRRRKLSLHKQDQQLAKNLMEETKAIEKQPNQKQDLMLDTSQKPKKKFSAWVTSELPSCMQPKPASWMPPKSQLWESSKTFSDLQSPANQQPSIPQFLVNEPLMNCESVQQFPNAITILPVVSLDAADPAQPVFPSHINFYIYNPNNPNEGTH